MTDDRIGQWVEKRNTSLWAEGWSEDFKAGYDAAVLEVEAMLPKCSYRKPYAYACGLIEAAAVHVRENKRMRPGAHVFRVKP